jgi:hypothetical protein
MDDAPTEWYAFLLYAMVTYYALLAQDGWVYDGACYLLLPYNTPRGQEEPTSTYLPLVGM